MLTMFRRRTQLEFFEYATAAGMPIAITTILDFLVFCTPNFIKKQSVATFRVLSPLLKPIGMIRKKIGLLPDLAQI